MQKNVSEKNEMNGEVAVKVAGVNKSFMVPHERHTTLKSTAINAFVRKGYEKFEALTDISFEVKKGEFFGIIGRNGSGKSTLLKMLAGIYVPDSGKITVNGKLSPFLELGVGFNPELTGRENLYLGGAILGLSHREVAEKFDKIVQFAELEEFIDLKFKNYSSGMAVRLAFSLSINVHAEILLMDEVLAVGDTNFQKKCLNEFNKYKEAGKTIVLVTHDIETAKRYCDRAMWIKDSKIKMLGDTANVCNMYAKSNIEEARQQHNSGNVKDKQGAVYIKGIDFLFSGKKVESISQGGSITVRAYIEGTKDVGLLNFGLAIFNENDHYIFGINTFNSNVDTSKWLKRGYFEVDYTDVPLRSGIFYIKAGIWGDSIDNNFDFFESPNFFSIVSTDQNQGEVGMNYKWRP